MLVFAPLGASPTALATLGGDAPSIDADRARVQATASERTPSAGYSVEQLTLPTGTVVREYLAAGKVFAVTWRGRVPPDLRVLLGGYFSAYAAAAAGAHHHNHHHVSVVQPDLVMQSGGHMRALAGRAYVPSLLPPDFSVDDIR